MDIWKSVIGRAFSSITVKIAGAGISFFYYAFISRSLKITEAGTVFFCFALILVLSSLARMGLDNAVVKEIGLSGTKSLSIALRTQIKISIAAATFAALFFSGVAWYFAGLISELVGIPERHKFAFTVFALSVPFCTIYSSIVFVLNGLERNVVAAAIQTLLPQLIAFALSFILINHVISIDGLDAFALAYLAGSVLIALFAVLVFCRIPKGDLMEKEDEGAEASSLLMLRSGFKLFPGSIADLCINLLPVIVVGVFATSAQVALFSVPQRICGIIFFIFASINTAASPRLSRAYLTGGFSGLWDAYKKTTLMMIGVMAPISVITAIFGDRILGFFGEAYGAAYWVLCILLAAQFVNAAFGPVLFSLIAMNKRAYYNISMYVGAVSVVCFIALLSGFWGALGGAIAVFIGVFLQKLTAYLLVRKKA